jgi:chromosome segregation ATPase
MESNFQELKATIQKMVEEHEADRKDWVRRLCDEEEKSTGLAADLAVALAERDQADAKLEEWDATEQFRAGQVMLLRKQVEDLRREVEQLRATPASQVAEIRD